MKTYHILIASFFTVATLCSAKADYGFGGLQSDSIQSPGLFSKSANLGRKLSSENLQFIELKQKSDQLINRMESAVMFLKPYFQGQSSYFSSIINNISQDVAAFEKQYKYANEMQNIKIAQDAYDLLDSKSQMLFAMEQIQKEILAQQ